MRRSASPASQRYISTIVPPAAVVAKAPQLLAVTWNKGVVISATGGGATGGTMPLAFCMASAVEALAYIML